MKTCKKCGELKDVSEFYISNFTDDGLQSWCKNCHKEYVRGKYNFSDRKKSKAQKYADLIPLLRTLPDIVSYSDILKIQRKCGFGANNLVSLSYRIFYRLENGLYKKVKDIENSDKVSVETPFVNSVQKYNTLESFTDKQLIYELKRRGFTGKLVTKQEIEL